MYFGTIIGNSPIIKNKKNMIMKNKILLILTLITNISFAKNGKAYLVL